MKILIPLPHKNGFLVWEALNFMQVKYKTA